MQVKEAVKAVQVELNSYFSSNMDIQYLLTHISNMDIQYLLAHISRWHHERNLIHGSTDKDQFHKLIQECGELSDSMCKGKDIKDDIGDIIVVLINIAERNNLTIKECVAKAWDDIKDRKGEMRDGIFIKEADL